jgi:hypothetical protein
MTNFTTNLMQNLTYKTLGKATFLAMLLGIIFGLTSCFLFIPRKLPPFPNHGYYCSPFKQRAASMQNMPIDMVDLACKSHDLCYIERGMLDYECDEKIILELSRIYPVRPNEIAVKNAILQYFKVLKKVRRY